MEKEEKLLLDYKKQQQGLDERESDIRSYQKKGEKVIEDLFNQVRNESCYDENSQDELSQVYNELRFLEFNYQETLDNEQKKLNRQREDIETNYRENYQKLMNS